ncbi:MAG: MOSC domain-containing protein, partial [Anaerolineales bacterium]|nr:MOSC domain-containing protein [Anaerolineales bacterium]
PRPSDTTGFADGYPILVLSEESLMDLNRRLTTPLPMNRFRPNIVVRGAAPYAEDTWRRFTINGLAFEGVKTCARCAVTTTDQTTAAREREPLATLATYRDSDRGVLFGKNVIQTPPDGGPTLNWGGVAVGDTVIVDC